MSWPARVGCPRPPRWRVDTVTWHTAPAGVPGPCADPSRKQTMVSLDQLPEIRTDLFIGGESRTADDALQIVDPADGVSVVGYAAAASAKQAEEAVAAAHRAFPGWASRAPQERAALIMAALAPLEADRPATAEVLTRENGKIRMESFIDSIVFAHRFALAAELADEVQT